MSHVHAGKGHGPKCTIYREKPYQQVIIADLLTPSQLSLYVKISNNGNAQQGRVPYLANAYFDATEYSVAVGTQYSIPKRVDATLAFVDMQSEPPDFTAAYGPASPLDFWWLGRNPSAEYTTVPKQQGQGEQNRVLVRRLTSFISVAPTGESPGIPLPVAGNLGNGYCDVWLYSVPDLIDVRMSASIQINWLDCRCLHGG